MVELRNIATVVIGTPFRSRIEPSDSGNTRLIQIKDLGNDNLVRLSGAVRVNLSVRPSQLAQVGDIIFRSRGTASTAVLLNSKVKDTIVSAPLFRIRANPKRVQPEYLLWWINQPSSQAYFNSRSEGTRLKMVSKEVLKSLEVDLPPLEEQSKIAKLFKLSMREQNLLEKIKKRRALCIQRILMRLASESRQTASNKKSGVAVSVSNPDQVQQKIKVNIMVKGKNQHVVPHGKEWAVRGEGNSKVTKVFGTQLDAIKNAEEIARNQKSDTKVHGRAGKIRAGNSYGNDPCPPKDKK